MNLFEHSWTLLNILAMANSNMINPPVFKDGYMQYEQWRKDIKLWTLLTDLPKSKMAIAVHLSLSGSARKATSELTEDELNAENGLTTLLTRLDKVYLQDANWNIFNNYLTFETFCRASETSIEDFFSGFDHQCCKLKECGVELPDAVLACRLLKSFNLSNVHFQLALTTISCLTLDNMRKTLRRLFSDDGIICIPNDNEDSRELTHTIKFEPVRISEGYQEHYTNNSKQLEECSNYFEGIKEIEQDKAHPGETQSITGETEHIVANQSNNEEVEHEQDQFYSHEIIVKKEMPDYIEGIEFSDEYFVKIDYSNQDHNLNKQKDQEKIINCNEGIGNQRQTPFHNESIDCWLRRNLCIDNIQNPDQFNIEQTKQQNINSKELRKPEANRIERNNLQVFQTEKPSLARKSGRQAKRPEKFKEYVYVPLKKKSQSPNIGHTQSSKEKSLESKTNSISTVKNQELLQSEMSSSARKSGRQAKLPEKFKEYLYVPPKKNRQSPKIEHTQSSKEKSLELNTNSISTVTNQEHANKGIILPEGWRKEKIMTSDVSDRNFDVYYLSPSGKKLYTHKEVRLYCLQQRIEVDLKLFSFNRGRSKGTINAKNRTDKDDNSNTKEGKTPDQQDHADGSTNGQNSCSSSPDQNKDIYSSEYKAPFACPHCPRRFRINSKYLQHLKVHTKVKLHNCTQCYRSFESDQSLSIHLLYHRNPLSVGPFICSYCSKEFDHKFAWQRHVYIFHEQEDSKAVQVCHACKMSFRSNPIFRRHRLKYHREEVNKEKKENEIEKKMFKVCPFCKKVIKKKSFYAHLKIHKEGRERDNMCSHCGKGFSNNGNLRRHKLSCFVKKEYTFSSESNMYKCLISNCERQFMSKQKLRNHMRVHKERKRSHLCSICSKGFTRNDRKNQHELVCQKKKIPVKKNATFSSTDSDPSFVNT